MSTAYARPALIIAVALLLVGIAPSAARAEDKSAAARLEAMANLLAKAQRLGVVVDCSYDVVQSSGQKIEFGERRTLRLRRPDRVRVDVTRRDGARRGMIFDGTQLTTFDLDQKVYSTVARPGTLDAALTYYTQDLNMRLPLRELFAADLPQALKEVLSSARLVGKETLGEIATDHIAMRGKTADVQIWIARDGHPLPQRILLTYRQADGQPQFAANFHGWTFDPEVSDAAFTFAPPPGAEKISILTPGPADQAGEKRP